MEDYAMTSPPAPKVTDADVRVATELLVRYRAGKAHTDARICSEAAWWQSRHGIGVAGQAEDGARPVSAWLFSSVCNKHADMCDARPTCTVLPREPEDEAAAGCLSDILPVIAARSHFDQIYSDNAWSKLKHGMAAYGVFWNPVLENGIGNIDIRRVDVLNLYWEPGVSDIQDSPHLFIVGMEETEALVARYPMLSERRAALRNGDALLTPEMGGSYLTQGNAGNGDKTAVVDWYYKRTLPDGRTVLHYAKFSGDVLLYASENDPSLCERGWYDHGKYPIVLDVLYPEEGTASGFGLIAVGRNPQGYVDELDGHMLEYANHASRVRYWAKRSLGVNEKEFLDPNRRIIEVEGDIDEEKLRQITVGPMDGMLTDVRRMKIDELKETTGNMDVAQGTVMGGVTAAAAISALQEAGNKSLRDCLSGSYRAYVELMYQVVELVRQFYGGVRCFRVSDGQGESRYIYWSGEDLRPKETGSSADGCTCYRSPAFDIEVRAERENPMDRMSRNEWLLSLFRAGFLDPEHEVAARRALAGMDFAGIDTLRAALGGQSPT